jgi:integrase
MRARGNIRKRGRNSWQIKFDVPVGGQRRTKFVTVQGTRQDAQRELAKLLTAADAGLLVDPSNMTVEQYLRQWLDGATAQSPKTLERYAELAARQIVPHLGDVKIQKLTVEQIRSWHRALLDTGLSARTVGHAHRLLRLVLGHAVRAGTLPRNVAAIERPPAVEADEVEIMPPEQLPAILSQLQGSTIYPIVSLALATGMRRGELLALRWSDIDLNKGTLRVERSVEETKAGLRVKPPKTKRAKRNLTLHGAAVAMLHAHRKQQLELRMRLGQGRPDDDAWVFSNIEGGLISPHSVSRSWRRFLIDHKLPRVSFHALRHTHASVLIADGVPIPTVSRRLGHSKSSITLDVYTHLLPGADQQAADAIAKVLK